MILDLTAAKILRKQGVDVGIVETRGEICANEEYFPAKNRYVGLFGCAVTDISIDSKAQVQSYCIAEEKQYIYAYTYENTNGQKFLVYAFDGYRMSEHAFKQPARGEQIVEAIKWMGKVLPAEMLGNPDCYMLCKENEAEKAVWIGNFFPDECMNKTVLLDKEYSEIEFINCKGKLSGKRVEIDYIAPYASVGFRVK